MSVGGQSAPARSRSRSRNPSSSWGGRISLRLPSCSNVWLTVMFLLERLVRLTSPARKFTHNAWRRLYQAGLTTGVCCSNY